MPTKMFNGRKFVNQQERIEQSKKWRNEFRNPYPCDICGKRFRNKDLVKGHKQWEHAY